MVSQYDPSVKAAWRDSACGPTATHIVLSHYGLTYSINELYRTLGTTRLGLFTPCLIRNAKRLLGDDFVVARASVKTVMKLLDCHLPVLAKFDCFTSCTPWRKAYYRYHWVVLTSYYLKHDQLHFIGNSNGNIFTFDYATSAHALTFVQLTKRDSPLR